MRVPVVVKVYSDRSFEMETKSPVGRRPVEAGGGDCQGRRGPRRKEKVGTVTRAQIDEIVKKKAKDLNARDPEHARRMIEGTARSMGLDVVD